MKRLFILILALCLCTTVLLASCGEGENNEGAEGSTEKTDSTTDSSTVGSTTDSSTADSTTDSSTFDSTADSSTVDSTTDSSTADSTTSSTTGDGEGEGDVEGEKNVKYDYEDMSEYIQLPDFKNHIFELDENDVKLAIGTYLMQFSSEYTVQRGDKIQVDIKFYSVDPEIDMKDGEITSLFQDDLWIEQVAKPYSDGGYQLSSQIEETMLGAKIGTTMQRLLTIDDDFFVEEYRGERLFVDITINNRISEVGDVVLASYTGYYLDENGQIVVENGQEKIFDTSDSSSFFLGSRLAIDDFEKGLEGLMIGEEKDVYATFPEDYSANEELAGQRVLFKVKIKAFYCAPIYNNDFVATYFSTFETTEEFETALKNEYILSVVYDYIDDNAIVFKYPTAEYEDAEAQLEELAKSFYQQYGISLDDYIQYYYGMTRDEYIKSNMKTEMILYALRNMIGTDAIPTDDEIEDERAALIESYKDEYMTSNGMSESQATVEAIKMVDALGQEYIYEQVMYEKIDDIIPTLVKITEVPSEHDYAWENK